MTTSLEDALTRYQAAFTAPVRAPVAHSDHRLVHRLAGNRRDAGRVRLERNHEPVSLPQLPVAGRAGLRRQCAAAPHQRATLSINTIFILMSIADLTMAQTVIVATVAAAVEQLWNSRSDTDLPQLLFHMSATTLAASVSAEFLRPSWIRHRSSSRRSAFAIATVPVLCDEHGAGGDPGRFGRRAGRSTPCGGNVLVVFPLSPAGRDTHRHLARAG